MPTPTATLLRAAYAHASAAPSDHRRTATALREAADHATLVDQLEASIAIVTARRVVADALRFATAVCEDCGRLAFSPAHADGCVSDECETCGGDGEVETEDYDVRPCPDCGPVRDDGEEDGR